MTTKESKQSIGMCGLACVVCSYQANCAGCRDKDGDCAVKKCCSEKELDYCFLCDAFPCDEGMFANPRVRAFNRVAREDGVQRLREYLMRNAQNGIRYHREDGIKGDYDRLGKERDVMTLLKDGRLDPYEVSPNYESRSFLLRLVSADDAEDLLRCYGDKRAQRFFNEDNCDFGYGNADTPEKMRHNIHLWLSSYYSKDFVRFSIVSKSSGRVVGTIEIFGGQRGVLRIDIMPEYEREDRLSELLELADRFFHDFDCDCIISKAIPEAVERRNALAKCGYTPFPSSETWSRKDYYIKQK